VRFSIAVLFLILCLQSLTKADDISDFEIEGVSIGDSGLIYATKKELDEKKKDWFKDKKYSISADIELNNLKQYDKLQFVYFTNDKNYILQGIEGIKFYRSNIKECYSDFDYVVDEIKDLFQNLAIEKKTKATHAYDKTGKSTYTYQAFIFDNNDTIYLACEDWSEESGFTDSLRVSLRTKNYSDFLTYKAY
tara:strand:- start:426 stop:1001 length:576 start_codon:yes stop_codon:yes gene_type:complete